MFSFMHRPSIPKYNLSKSDKISPDESAHLSVCRANRAHIDNTAAVSCPENPPPVFALNHDLHEVLVISCNSCSYHIAVTITVSLLTCYYIHDMIFVFDNRLVIMHTIKKHAPNPRKRAYSVNCKTSFGVHCNTLQSFSSV